MNVPILELKTQYQQIKSEIDAAISEVFEASWFVLGKQGQAFEEEFAAWCGARFCVGCGSGTEAIHLALVAVGVQHGDEVITVPNTAVPTCSAISAAGATPVFVDVNPDTYTMDVAQVESKITPKTKAIVPVHLYGHPVDMDALLEVAQRHSIPVVDDAAQAHGAQVRGRRIGSFGNATAWSFYPSKNLGAYGDSGAVTTNDEALRDQLVRLRNYGEERRYYHPIKGFNSRLDEIHAAMLRVKLRYLDEWNAARRRIAEFYLSHIVNPLITLPQEKSWARHSWHLFVVRCGADFQSADLQAGCLRYRDALRAHLQARGVGSQIHYPIPIHRQQAYADLNLPEGSLPVAEKLANEVLSLPLYPEMTEEQAAYVCEAVNEFKA